MHPLGIILGVLLSIGTLISVCITAFIISEVWDNCYTEDRDWAWLEGMLLGKLRD